MNENGNNVGCTGECSKCSSAQHSYCAVIIARKNQELLLGILGAMAQPKEDLITPKQGGDEDPDENKPKNKTK